MLSASLGILCTQSHAQLELFSAQARRPDSSFVEEHWMLQWVLKMHPPDPSFPQVVPTFLCGDKPQRPEPHPRAPLDPVALA